MKAPMLQNSEGQASTSVTIAWAGLIYVFVVVLLGVIEEITIGTRTFKFRPADPTIITSILGSTLGLYGYRRHIDKKFKANPILEDLKKSD